jgi:hypothetical protein
MDARTTALTNETTTKAKVNLSIRRPPLGLLGWLPALSIESNPG